MNCSTDDSGSIYIRIGIFFIYFLFFNNGGLGISAEDGTKMSRNFLVRVRVRAAFDACVRRNQLTAVFPFFTFYFLLHLQLFILTASDLGHSIIIETIIVPAYTIHYCER